MAGARFPSKHFGFGENWKLIDRGLLRENTRSLLPPAPGAMGEGEGAQGQLFTGLTNRTPRTEN